ncbi:hypothetical protein [Deinococcus sp.]|uniref:hypothetical protein n=1 Tax=Deinococcus sp. TaxID=47478 RepID=UPI00391D47F2
MTRSGRRLAITDNNLLVNFVDAGQAELLSRYCQDKILISPSVIEPTEVYPFLSPPTSEFNIIIHKAQLALARHARLTAQGETPDPPDALLQRRAMFRLEYLSARNTLWETVELTEDDARYRYTLQQDPRMKRLKRRQADAECLSLAHRRGLTLLTDDQPVVDAAGLLGVTTLRTCGLLIEMVNAGLLSAGDAASLFNGVMVDQLNFSARRKRGGARERLVLTAHPLSCQWVLDAR